MVVGLGLTGCGAFHDRNRDPLFEEARLSISTIGHEGDDNHWQTVCNLLNKWAPLDCQSIKRTNCQQVGSIRVCDYDSVILRFDPPVTWKTIQLLHEELLALKQQGVTLGFKTGSFSAGYVGLIAEGDISINVRISVNPDATLFLERRWEGICEEVAMIDNFYDGEISLRKNQEWVFYRTEVQTGSDLVSRYFRLNIITKRAEELSQKDFDKLISRP